MYVFIGLYINVTRSTARICVEKGAAFATVQTLKKQRPGRCPACLKSFSHNCRYRRFTQILRFSYESSLLFWQFAATSGDVILTTLASDIINTVSPHPMPNIRHVLSLEHGIEGIWPGYNVGVQ